MKKMFLLLTVMIFSMFMVSCATDDGDKSKCEECDNVTELLVGEKCVPIAEIEECGPNGHAHGDVCHCFDEKDPVQIGDKFYCLSTCGTEVEEDVDALACEAKDAEAVTCVEGFENFSNVHLHTGELLELTLSETAETFAHFPITETTEMAVYVEKAGVLDSAYYSDKTEITKELIGANPDCSSQFVEVYHLAVTKAGTDAAIPGILKFKPTTGTVKIFIHEAGHE